MPRYSKGTVGKLIVQDWDVISSYADTLVLRQITLRQMSALVALAEYLAWSTRYLNAPPQDTIDAFSADTRKNLMVDVQICALIIGCIADDDDVRTALNQWFIEQMADYGSDVYQSVQNVYNPYLPGQQIPETIAGQNLLPAIVDCDFDVLWGSITQLVDSMNENNKDSFEVAETATNLAERASLVLGGIPILETLPVDEAVAYVNTIWTDDLFEAYIANDTTEYTDTLKCALFCIASSHGCRLSISDVYEYFIGRIAGDSSDTFAELIAYLITGTWAGTEINDLFYAGQLLVMFYGNKFFSIVGIRPFQQYLQIGSLSPSSAWTIICEPCAIVPNVYLESNIPIDFELTFIENIGEDESIWTAVTKDNLGIYAMSCNPTWFGDDICVEVIEVSPVTAYQHFLCGSGAVVSGSGDGASDTVFYQELGWYTIVPETLITIHVRRI